MALLFQPPLLKEAHHSIRESPPWASWDISHEINSGFTWREQHQFKEKTSSLEVAHKNKNALSMEYALPRIHHK